MNIYGMTKVVEDLTIVDFFAALLPEPTKEQVEHEMHMDIARNPHNDSWHPKRRTDLEIKCQLRYQYANMMMKERSNNVERSTNGEKIR